MFWKSSISRHRVTSYGYETHRPFLYVHYIYTQQNDDGDGTARIEVVDIQFIDVEARDLFLAELDSGKVFLIDRAKIRGLK